MDGRMEGEMDGGMDLSNKSCSCENLGRCRIANRLRRDTIVEFLAASMPHMDGTWDESSQPPGEATAGFCGKRQLIRRRRRRRNTNSIQL